MPQPRRAAELGIFRELLAPATGYIIAKEGQNWDAHCRAGRHLLESAAKAPLIFDQLEWGQGTPKRGISKRSYDGQIYITVGQDGVSPP